MSLQRLLVYSPLAALVAACLAVRVASEQTARRHDSALPLPIPATTGLQKARSVETASDVARATSWLPASLNTHPPADVPGLSGLEPTKGNTAATAKASGGELATANSTGKTSATSRPAALTGSSAPKSAPAKLGGQTPLRKPEAWTPPFVYGPPLPPERIQVQKQAHQLRTDLKAGRIALVMAARDGEQLKELERSGVYGWPAPPPNVIARSDKQRNVLAGTTEIFPALPPKPTGIQLASRSGERERSVPNPADNPDFDPCAVPPSPLLLRLLTTLAGHSTPSHPLEILSLLRPPYRFGSYVHVGPANPHSMGLAVDIGAYGGHAIRQSDGEACVAATLALLRDLPPGRYRLGMPKAPEGGWDLPPALTTLLGQSTPKATPAKSAPLAAKTSERNKDSAAMPEREIAVEEPVENTTACAVAALYGLYASSAKPAWPFFPPPFTQMVADEAASGDGASKSTHAVLRFQNEAYAPESELTDARLRNALEQARRRGVDVVALFPDGADHIHVDVRQNP